MNSKYLKFYVYFIYYFSRLEGLCEYLHGFNVLRLNFFVEYPCISGIKMRGRVLKEEVSRRHCALNR